MVGARQRQGLLQVMRRRRLVGRGQQWQWLQVWLQGQWQRVLWRASGRLRRLVGERAMLLQRLLGLQAGVRRMCARQLGRLLVWRWWVVGGARRRLLRLVPLLVRSMGLMVMAPRRHRVAQRVLGQVVFRQG